MRSPIAFSAEDGTTLRGWHYVPDRSRKYYPTVVFAHGFTALKEHYLDNFADAFAKAGFASIVFDNRGFGESDGLPRQHIDPWKQISDYRDAITYAETLPETDARRIAVWGTSYSGGRAMVVAAIDRRVMCVVAQVPLTSGHANIRRMLRGDFLSALQRQCEDDRHSRKAGKLRKMIAAITNDPDIPAGRPAVRSVERRKAIGSSAASRRPEASVHRLQRSQRADRDLDWRCHRDFWYTICRCRNHRLSAETRRSKPCIFRIWPFCCRRTGVAGARTRSKRSRRPARRRVGAENVLCGHHERLTRSRVGDDPGS